MAFVFVDYPMIDAAFGAGAGGHALPGMAPGGGVAPATGSSSSSSALKSVDRVRNVFPETWLWRNASVGFVNCSESII